MAKKRANGDGNIRKRADGRWKGRYTAGYNKNKHSLRGFLSASGTMLILYQTIRKSVQHPFGTTKPRV